MDQSSFQNIRSWTFSCAHVILHQFKVAVIDLTYPISAYDVILLKNAPKLAVAENAESLEKW